MDIAKIQIESKARGIEEITAIVLSSKETTRKLFCPTIANDELRGYIVFQRKGINDKWEELEKLNLNTFKAKEWTKVELHTKELALVLEYVNSMKSFISKRDLFAFNNYVMFGMRDILTEDESQKFIEAVSRDPGLIKEIAKSSHNEVYDASKLLNFINSNFETVNNALDALGSEAVEKLNIASRLKLLDIKQLEKLINDSASEEQFQKYFENNPGFLSLVIPTLLQVILKKPYCGGKQVDNTGGVYSDFLYKQGKNNCSFIEIKTPNCELVTNSINRTSINSISQKIVDAVIQVKNEKDLFYKTMAHGSNEDFYDSPCYVIAGMSKSLDTTEKKNCFELFRVSLKDVVIIPYDELIEKVKLIRQTLTGINSVD